jgi:hypothetical protein
MSAWAAAAAARRSSLSATASSARRRAASAASRSAVVLASRDWQAARSEVFWAMSRAWAAICAFKASNRDAAAGDWLRTPSATTARGRD